MLGWWINDRQWCGYICVVDVRQTDSGCCGRCVASDGFRVRISKKGFINIFAA